MPRFTVKLDGKQQFVGALGAWERTRSAQVAALIARTAESIAQDAAEQAPVASGRLRGSIRADLARVLTDLVADVVAGAFYARFVEQGTRRLRAHPFLFPAWERASRGFYDDLRAILS